MNGLEYNPKNDIDAVDQDILASTFNSGGYVLDFTDATFAQFTIKSVGVSIQEKYHASKGRSLALFTQLGEISKVIKLYRDLIRYYETKWPHEISQKSDRAERILSLKKILDKYNTSEVKVDIVPGLIIETPLFCYKVKKQLREGGNSLVYAVENNDTGKIFVAKVIKKELLAQSEKLKRFKQEIMFLQANSNSNLVRIIDSGRLSDGRLFYLMEKAEGTLRDVINRVKRPDYEELIKVISGILDGVSFLHKHSVIHRDLKPENILMFGDIPVVADVGIAHFSADDLVTTIKTRDDSRMANFRYAAPEQCSGEMATTTASDVYALALIIHEVITGEFLRGTNPKRIISYWPQLSNWDSILDKARSNSPSLRPQTAGELKDLLFKGIAGKMSISEAIEIVKTTQKQQFVRRTEKTEGVVSFDFVKNDGRYIIDVEGRVFRTHWSRRGGDSVYVIKAEGNIGFNDQLAELPSEISSVEDYDWTTDHTRAVYINEILVFQNQSGDLLAVQVLDVKDVERGAKVNCLSLAYRLLDAARFQLS